MKYLLFPVFFLHFFFAFSQEPHVVESLAFGGHLSPLVKVKNQGKEYYVHPTGGQWIDEVNEHAADLFVVVKDGWYGVLKEDGHLIVPFEYDDIKLQVAYDGQWYEGIPYKYKCIILKKDGKVGAANENGDIVVPLCYQDAKAINSKVIGVADNGLWGWVSAEDGKVIQPPAYAYVRDFFNSDYVEVRNGELAGLAHAGGGLVVPVEFDGYMRYLADGKQTLFEGLKKNKSSVFSTDGKLIASGYASYTSISNSDLLIFQENERYGIFDPVSQRVVAAPAFEMIKSFIRGLAIAKKNGKYGVIDVHGRPLLDFQYDELHFLSADGSYNLSSGSIVDIGQNPSKKEDEKLKARRKHEAEIDQQPYLIEVVKGKFRGIIDWKGTTLISAGKYHMIRPVYYGGKTFFQVMLNDSMGILNEQGREMLPVKYGFNSSYQFSSNVVEYQYPIQDRFVAFSAGKDEGMYHAKLGLFDLKLKKIVVDPAQQAITIVNSTLIKIRKSLPDNGYELCLYDIEKDKTAKLAADVVDYEVLNNRFLMQQLKNDRYRLTDLNGNTVYENAQWTTRGSYELIRFPHAKGYQPGEFYHGLKKVYADKGNLFIDESGVEKRFEGIDQVDDFYEGVALAAKKIESQESHSKFKYVYGIIDPQGRHILSFEYDRVSAIGQDAKLLQLFKDKFYGLVLRNGHTLLPAVYSTIESYDNNPYIIVAKNEKYGMTDKLGNVILPLQYDDITRNSYGADSTWPILVKEGEWYYFVDSNGQKSTIKSKQTHY